MSEKTEKKRKRERERERERERDKLSICKKKGERDDK